MQATVNKISSNSKKGTHDHWQKGSMALRKLPALGIINFPFPKNPISQSSCLLALSYHRSVGLASSATPRITVEWTNILLSSDESRRKYRRKRWRWVHTTRKARGRKKERYLGAPTSKGVVRWILEQAASLSSETERIF